MEAEGPSQLGPSECNLHFLNFERPFCGGSAKTLDRVAACSSDELSAAEPDSPRELSGFLHCCLERSEPTSHSCFASPFSTCRRSSRNLFKTSSLSAVASTI